MNAFPASMQTLTISLSVWFAVITVGVIALLVVVYRRFERRDEDQKELISDFDAESAYSAGTRSGKAHVELDFASTAPGSPPTGVTTPARDEDGLDAPAVQVMMENSSHAAAGVHSTTTPVPTPSSPNETPNHKLS